MIFSRAAEYAIQALLYLAKWEEEHPDYGYVQTKEIAEAQGIPYYFLAKIVQDLTRFELLNSAKGPTGGLSLAKPPDQITILDIIAAVDSTQYLSRCVIGYPECTPETPCPLHYDWQKIKERIFKIIQEKTLADLVKEATYKEGRLIAPLTYGVVSVELPEVNKSSKKRH